jgi:uncharacterized protein YlxW (UPF0749 family)
MRRPRAWSVLSTVVALGAGLLMATSASTARGRDLRSGRRLELTELVDVRAGRVAALSATAARLRDQVRSATSAAASRDERVEQAEAAANVLAGPVGTQAVTGPGIEVSLDDAPRPAPGEGPPPDATPDDLVVHEQDVHAVLNALWAGGAEAVTVMGDRIIGTSSARCVGNTLLLHGAVYSPPFVLRAIGDPAALTDALETSPGVNAFRDYVQDFGLGYEVTTRRSLLMPAYNGPLDLQAATPMRAG